LILADANKGRTMAIIQGHFIKDRTLKDDSNQKNAQANSKHLKTMIPDVVIGFFH
jgi:hypothetical protein